MHFVFASGHTAAAVSLLARLKTAIIYPLMTLITAIALILFLWGVFQYVSNAGSEDGRVQGKRHMLFGIIGLFIIVTALAILEIAAGTFGIGVELN